MPGWRQTPATGWRSCVCRPVGRKATGYKRWGPVGHTPGHPHEATGTPRQRIVARKCCWRCAPPGHRTDPRPAAVASDLFAPSQWQAAAHCCSVGAGAITPMWMLPPIARPSARFAPNRCWLAHRRPWPATAASTCGWRARSVMSAWCVAKPFLRSPKIHNVRLQSRWAAIVRSPLAPGFRCAVTATTYAWW